MRFGPTKLTRRRRLAATVLGLSVGACSSIGPESVSHDRIDYASAIGNSWKEQTLLNIVKLRYADMPVFLKGNPPGDFIAYVTASEFSHLFGPGEPRRLFLTSRQTELQLNRRQRIRVLLRLSRLADGHSVDEFRDPTSAAHKELVVQRLER